MLTDRNPGPFIDLGDIGAGVVAFVILFLVMGPAGLVVGAILCAGTLLFRLYK